MYNHKKDWKSVPLPDKIKLLPTDSKGMPVPYVVYRDQAPGLPMRYLFAINDQRRSKDCIDHKICTICGFGLQDDTWFIGGPLSAFHPNGVFADLPTHKECGEYALKVCPYLAIPNYTNLKDIPKLQEKTGLLLDNLTAGNTKVPFFCFVHASAYVIKDRKNVIVSVDKPYKEVQYWWEGEQITPAKAVELYKAMDKEVITFVPK